MKQLEFRKLKADEIECRVAVVKEKGCSLLLYKDARCDQNILDETVGPMNWTKSYELIDGQLFCSISIWDDDKKQWISKQDVGTESYAEKEKGRASDAQKRSAFAWGIGRELYTAPFVWITDAKITKNASGNWTTYDRFRVSSISYDAHGRIDGLEIVRDDKSNKVVFKLNNKIEMVNNRISKQQQDDIVATAALYGRDIMKLMDYYKVPTLADMTTEQYQDCMALMEKCNKKTA